MPFYLSKEKDEQMTALAHKRHNYQGDKTPFVLKSKEIAPSRVKNLLRTAAFSWLLIFNVAPTFATWGAPNSENNPDLGRRASTSAFNPQIDYFSQCIIEAVVAHEHEDFFSQTLIQPGEANVEVVQKMLATMGKDNCLRMVDRLALEVQIRTILTDTYNTDQVIEGLSFSDQISAMLKFAHENPKSQVVGHNLKVISNKDMESSENPSIFFDLLLCDGKLVTMPVLILTDSFVIKHKVQ